MSEVKYVFSRVITEWTKKTVPLLKKEDKSIVGSLVCTPKSGWYPDNKLIKLVGVLPPCSSLRDAKERVVAAYENRHLISEQKDEKIKKLMEHGFSRKQAESVFKTITQT